MQFIILAIRIAGTDTAPAVATGSERKSPMLNSPPNSRGRGRGRGCLARVQDTPPAKSPAKAPPSTRRPSAEGRSSSSAPLATSPAKAASSTGRPSAEGGSSSSARLDARSVPTQGKGKTVVVKPNGGGADSKPVGETGVKRTLGKMQKKSYRKPIICKTCLGHQGN